MVASVQRDLQALGRTGTAKADLALELASRIDAGELKGTELAALSRELRILLDQVLAGASSAVDPLTELERRRLAKASGA